MGGDEASNVARARDGDAEAFRVLVEEHSRRLFRLAYRIAGNEQDAEDIVQETFIKAHRNLARYDDRATFGAWLSRIASNQALDVVRARARRGAERLEPHDADAPDPVERIPESGAGPERRLLSTEVSRRVTIAMNRLTSNERAAFVLRHHEELSIAEIGVMLKLSENATKQCIFRAVRKMRDALRPFAGQGWPTRSPRES
jgi:RNA polymerase sigma-70 factor (ECF subfamily)